MVAIPDDGPPQGILGVLTIFLYFGHRNFKSFSQVSIVDDNTAWLRKNPHVSGNSIKGFAILNNDKQYWKNVW